MTILFIGFYILAMLYYSSKEGKKMKKTLSCELTLLIIIIINSLGVVLMLHSGYGISAISSVPYAFSVVLPKLSLGTWTYIFQSILVITLMICRKKFVLSYLFSFVVSFAFGIMVDIHQMWVSLLPVTFGLRIVYFILSYLIICVGIALSNHCEMPIVATDLFPREFSSIFKIKYANVKVTFDVTCLCITAILTFVFLGYVDGLGLGTVLAALTMGKTIGMIEHVMLKYITFKHSFQYPHILQHA